MYEVFIFIINVHQAFVNEISQDNPLGVIFCMTFSHEISEKTTIYLNVGELNNW